MEKEVSLEIIQNCEFEMLKYIKRICDQHGLRYYLAYGTLLGAVRHQGFIPWDDDTDVHMPREDYLKFVEIVQRSPHPYYKLISRETTPKYTYLWPKLIDTRTKLVQKGDYIEREQLGVFLDIFLLDGAGNSQKEAEDRYQKAYLLYCHVKGAALKFFSPWEKKIHSVLHWLPHVPEKIMGIGYWMDQHSAFCGQLAFDEYEYVGAMGASTPESSRNIWKKEWFGNGTELVFMGESFRAPVNWDAVLQPEYGDYMQLPPEEKQRSNHTYSLEILYPLS